MSKLTAKQQRFADEYLLDCNATQAAIRAGYSSKTAKSLGQRLLTNVDIQSYVRNQLELLHNKSIANTDEVMKYLTAVLRGESISSVMVVENIGDYKSKARAITKNPDEKERLKAAELLGKRYGMFSGKVSVESTIPVVVTDDIGENDG